jgi:hypothetical protein
MRNVFYPAKGQIPKTKKDCYQSFCVALLQKIIPVSFRMKWQESLFAKHRNGNAHHHIGMQRDVERMITDLFDVAFRHTHLRLLY